MHGLITLFLEVIALAIILLVVGLAVPFCLCCCVNHNHGINHLNDDNQVSDRCNHVSCFDGNCDICGNSAACSLIHEYVL